MAIKNTSVVYDVNVSNNRKAIGHRATWMGLTYQAGVEAGVDAEGIARTAISKTGCLDGEAIKEACSDATDCRQFKEAFLNDLTKSTFQMEFPKVTEDDLEIEFHYCPLLAAWQKLGFDDETCAKLCDIAMDGDRNIAKTVGLKMELTDTIAKGCPTCKLHFYK